MKDSILAVPFYEEMIADEEELAIEKQKVYDDFLEEHGSLLNIVKTMETDEALNFLKECRCCVTHQINKPDEQVKWTEPQGGLELQYKQVEKPCKCDYIQLARNMCRGDDENYCNKQEEN